MEATVVLFFSWFVYCAILTGFELVVLTIAMGEAPPIDAFLMVYSFNLMQCWCVFGSLLIIRSVGFRFVRIDLECGDSSPLSFKK